MDWRQIANGSWIWVCGAVLAAIALYQCTYFAFLAVKLLRRYGLEKREVMGMLRGAAITSIGPVMVELFVMIALVVALSPGFAWQREGAAVGSVITELMQANNAAVGAGQELGGQNFDMTGFANVIFVVNVSCIGWMLFAGLFTRYLGRVRQMIAGSDDRWLVVLSICATLGIFGFWASTNLAKGGGALVAVVAGGGLAAFLFTLADRIGKPRLKEWALGLAMFGGMFIGKLFAGWGG
jgi:hypothetical protein